MFRFKHDFLTYQDLTTDESSGERHYILPDGTAVPSVTTVLSKLSKDGIDKWKARVGAEEAARVSGMAARRGTAIHEICEKYLRNNPAYKKGIMPVNLDTFRKMQPYLDRDLGTILGLEIPLYSKQLWTAGRTDCIAYWKDKLSIVDFKTSRKAKREEWIQNYFLQTTCYSLMAEEMFGLDIPQIVIIIAVDNEDPQIFRRAKVNYVQQVRELFRCPIATLPL